MRLVCGVVGVWGWEGAVEIEMCVFFCGIYEDIDV